MRKRLLNEVLVLRDIQRGRAVRSARWAHNPQVGGSNPPLAIFFLNFILETIKYRFWQKRPLMADYNVIVCNNGSPGKPSCIAWVREVNYVVVFDTMPDFVKNLGDGLQALLKKERTHPGGDMAPPSDGVASAALREDHIQGVPATVHRFNDDITIRLYDLTRTK